MSFQERIENTLADGSPSACPFIKLSEEERKLYYNGCGLVCRGLLKAKGSNVILPQYYPQ